jgi:pilus assembly protein Flp/PilA
MGDAMRQSIVRASRFLREEDGATAVEYAIMLVLIIAVCIAAIAILGQRVDQAFN